MAGRGRDPIPVPPGRKWCTRCKTHHDITAFGRDRTRGDGLAAHCLVSRHTGNPRGWRSKPSINPKTGRPGPSRVPRRSGDKKQARQRVNLDIRIGLLPRPKDLPCVDCGHIWEPGERRHEYDHHLGYAAERHLDVQAVCSTCHGRRTSERGEGRKR